MTPSISNILDRLTDARREVILSEGADWKERPAPIDGPARLTRVDNALIDLDLLEFDANPDWTSNVRTGSKAHGRDRLQVRLTPLGLEVQSALRASEGNRS